MSEDLYSTHCICFNVQSIHFPYVRFQSKKATRSTPQSSTNDLIIGNTKDGAYDDVAAPGFQKAMVLQPRCTSTARDDTAQANDMLAYFTRTQEPTCYDTLQSFPSVSSYNSTVVTDIDQDPNNVRMKRGDADGDRAHEGECMQERPRRHLNSGYETVHIRRDSDHPLRIPDYETVRNLQQMATDSTYECVQPNGSIGSLGKSKNRTCHSIPSALKIFLQPSAKLSESELCDGTVPAEIMALYAQVDKTKKRRFRADMPLSLDANHVVGNHVSSQTDEECGCIQQPVSDVHSSEDSCSSGVCTGNSKDCAANVLQDCRVPSPSGRPLPSVPNIHFIHMSQDNEPPHQTLECAQL